MRFSVWPNMDRSFEETLAVTKAAESYGWHAVYFADHFMPNGPDTTPLSGDVFESTTMLAALAATTSTIRLGTLVAAATYRHPAVLAKSFATLDNVSHGRAIVGLGAGWQENEHDSYGIELGSISRRIDRFSEYVQVVSSLLNQTTTNFHGEFYNLSAAPCEPRPVQSPMPLLLGVKGAKRTMAIAAQFATQWNAWCSPDEMKSFGDVLDTHCNAIGRDPKSVEHTTQALLFVSHDETYLEPHRQSAGGSTIVGTPSEVVGVMEKYLAAGCDEFIVPAFTLGNKSRTLETLEMFNEEVVSAFR